MDSCRWQPQASTATPYSGAGASGTAGTPLTVSFTVQDGSTSSGSTGSSTGTTSPPPAPSTSGNTSLPYGGQYLGCASYGGGKANNGFWTKHAYRFVAERTGAVKTVRWENRTGAGYSTGNGGSVQISIQTNSGGYPSGQKIGYTSVYANAANLGLYPVYTFASQPSLVYGTTYHLVFEQLAREPGHDLGQRPRLTGRRRPTASRSSPSRRARSPASATSEQCLEGDARADPDLRAHLRRRHRQGPAHDGRRPAQPAAHRRRQHGPPELHDLRPRRPPSTASTSPSTAPASVGPLTVRITDASNKVLFQTSVDGNQVSSSSSGDTSPLHWLYVPTSPITFAANSIYYVSFQAGAGGGLWALPINNGYFYGFRNLSLHLSQPQRPVQHQRRRQLGLVADVGRLRQQLDKPARLPQNLLKDGRPAPDAGSRSLPFAFPLFRQGAGAPRVGGGR